MGSEYTLEQPRSADTTTDGPVKTTPARPKGARMMSYLSTRSQSEASSGDDEQDKALLRARYAQGRQRSLAAIGRAMDRAAAADVEAEENDAFIPNRETVDGDYFPAQTPMEESYSILGDTPTMTAEVEQRSIFETPDQEIMELEPRHHEVIEGIPEEEEEEEEQKQEQEQEQEEQGKGEQKSNEERGSPDEQENEVGNETILDDLVAQHAANCSSSDSDVLVGNYGGYNYADEIEEDDNDAETTPKRVSLPRYHPSLNVDSRLSLAGFNIERQAHIAKTRSIDGSWTTDASEVGQVFEATIFNVPVRLPSLIASFDAPNVDRTGLLLSSYGGDPRQSSHTPPPVSMSPLSTRGGDIRRGSVPINSPNGLEIRRKSNTHPPIPSPLRPIEEKLQSKIISKKSSFSFARSSTPLRARATSASPTRSLPISPSKRSLPISPSVSPRSGNPGTTLKPSSPAGDRMSRQPSGNSQLRNQVSINPSPITVDSDGEGGPPGLAPSVASDSGSSDGALESPPFVPPTGTRQSLLNAPDLSEFNIKSAPPAPSWVPPDHLLQTAVDLIHTDIHTEPTSPSESPGSSNHSILPSVLSKIAQLESRDEALRKFSVSGASTQSMSLPPTPERPAAIKRRSYTTALAPRPVRSTSDVLVERELLGGTTFVARKVYAEHRDFSGGLLKRTGSAKSTTGSGEAIHGWDGRVGRLHAREACDMGSTRSREQYDMGMVGSRECSAGTSARSRGYAGGNGQLGSTDGGRDTERWAETLTDETDDSEGLL